MSPIAPSLTRARVSEIADLVAALQADDHLEVFVVGLLGRGHDLFAPKESTQTGFSMNTCFPALIAASK